MEQLGFLVPGSGYWREIYIRINQDLQFWCSTLEGKGKALPVLNYLSTMPWGSGGIALPFITSALFEAGELHSLAVLTPHPQRPLQYSLCTLDRWMGWCQSRSGLYGGQKNPAVAGYQNPAV
jgi:hypothetical protein